MYTGVYIICKMEQDNLFYYSLEHNFTYVSPLPPPLAFFFFFTFCYQYFRTEMEPPQPAPQSSHQAPAMMTFKQFLNAQDDNIGDEEAFHKYQEYKLEFRKTQMSDFFQQHKEEEWYVTIYLSSLEINQTRIFISLCRLCFLQTD